MNNLQHFFSFSKAVMDLFVDLCSQYHLNPAHYTFELQSWETQQSLSYRPNTLIGTLDVQKILLKLKLPKEKKIKRPPPKIPEVKAFTYDLFLELCPEIEKGIVISLCWIILILLIQTFNPSSIARIGIIGQIHKDLVIPLF